ncbi:MAG: phage holin family protein [Vicinamibacterales bacterium]
MQPFLVRCFTTALSLGVVSWVLPGVTITSIPALLVGAVVLALVNTIVKPVLVLLTLPLTFMTVGVFYFIVNGAAFSIAAWLVPGFIVSSFWWAILGAGLVGFVSMLVGGSRRPRKSKRVDVDIIDVRPS